MKMQARVQDSIPLYATPVYKILTISSAIQEDPAHVVYVDVFSIVRFSF